MIPSTQDLKLALNEVKEKCKKQRREMFAKGYIDQQRKGNDTKWQNT